MYTQESIFALWNYTLLFMTITTITAFAVDMIGHDTMSISSNTMKATLLFGYAAGEVTFSILPISFIPLKLGIAIMICLVVSVWIPWKYRTKDEVQTRRFKRKEEV